MSEAQDIDNRETEKIEYTKEKIELERNLGDPRGNGIVIITGI